MSLLGGRIVDTLKSELHGRTLQRVVGKLAAACQPVLDKLPEVNPLETFLQGPGQQPPQVETAPAEAFQQPATTSDPNSEKAPAKPATEASTTKASPATKKKTVAGTRGKR